MSATWFMSQTSSTVFTMNTYISSQRVVVHIFTWTFPN